MSYAKKPVGGIMGPDQKGASCGARPFGAEQGGGFMQHEITHAIPLLDERGNLTEPGWARRLLPVYDRARVKGGPTGCREWDDYLVMGPGFALALTIADHFYLGLDSISLLDFREGWQMTRCPRRPFPMGRTGLPVTSERERRRYPGGDTASFSTTTPEPYADCPHGRLPGRGGPGRPHRASGRTRRSLWCSPCPLTGRGSSISARRYMACGQMERCSWARGATTFTWGTPSASWIGGGGYGPAVTPGTGLQRPGCWEASPSAFTWGAAWGTPAQRRKTYCSIRGEDTSSPG